MDCIRRIIVGASALIVAAFVGLIFFIFLTLIGAVVTEAHARDLGQWEGVDSRVQEWFRNLKQPDQPTVSCCGEADAVEADDWWIEDRDHIAARVTNGRGIVPDGTVVNVPLRKLKQDAGNPTGHAILFLSKQAQVYCFVVGAAI